MSQEGELPRYSSALLPPYSYVPGFTPHPISDPRGHMVDVQHEQSAPLTPSRWHKSTTYLFGIDLFNHGYYWEAHEAWESLWHAAGRRGDMANFLKSLIKLAAAGVKAREGNPAGVQRHAARAVELLNELTFATDDSAGRLCGLEIAALTQEAKELAQRAESFNDAVPNRRIGINLVLQELPA